MLSSPAFCTNIAVRKPPSRVPHAIANASSSCVARTSRMLGSCSIRTRISPSQLSGTAIAAPKPRCLSVSRISEGLCELAICSPGFNIDHLLRQQLTIVANLNFRTARGPRTDLATATLGTTDTVVDPSLLMDKSAGDKSVAEEVTAVRKTSFATYWTLRTEELNMKRFLLALFVLAVAVPAQAQDKLVVSIWGGSWRDLVAETVAKKFTKETGVPVEFITGGTIDRLNKAKLAKGNPDSDITFTTSHVGWLYANDSLFETLDLAKIPNAKNLADEARISPFHIGAWAYVYAIGCRADLLANMKFESWNDLWKPELKGKIAGPDFDPSHIIAVSAILSGSDAAHWEKGQEKLKQLKPNFKAFYTNDANSQQLLASGETPVQIVLSMNAYYMIGQGVPITLAIPREG